MSKGKKIIKILIIGILVMVVANIVLSKINSIRSNKIGYIPEYENTNMDEQDTIIDPNNFVPTTQNIRSLKTLDQLKTYVYTIDSTAYVGEGDIDIDKLMSIDLSTDLHSKKPKILIFHTHSQEAYIDSRPGVEEDTIIGVGQELAEILSKEYGISVVHDVGKYDIQNNQLMRESSYEVMEPAIQSILKKYPSIEVTIDLHRDGVDKNLRLVTDVNGKPTAKIMFFNGISKLNKDGKPVDLTALINPYVDYSLALSLNMFLKTNELYPGLARKIYIKPYRYSLHLTSRSMLVEVGANTNTLEEAKNAMDPLAQVIVDVLGEK